MVTRSNTKPIILTDTGPITGQHLPKDQHQELTLRFINSQPYGFIRLTTIPCLTEAFYLLKSRGRPDLREQIIRQIRDGDIQIHFLNSSQVKQAFEIMRTYSPKADFADATLVAAAAALNLKTIFTFDSDFTKYQMPDGSYLTIIPEHRRP